LTVGWYLGGKIDANATVRGWYADPLVGRADAADGKDSRESESGDVGARQAAQRILITHPQRRSLRNAQLKFGECASRVAMHTLAERLIGIQPIQESTQGFFRHGFTPPARGLTRGIGTTVRRLRSA